MYALFTTMAREVVVVATDEARIAGHACVAAEHLLLALLLPPDADAARVLAGFDAPAEQISADLLRRIHADRECRGLVATWVTS